MGDREWEKKRKIKESWVDLHVVRKLTLTREHGLRKKMIDSSLIFEFMARGVGGPSPKQPGYSGAARAAGFVGSTIFAPISSGAISPRKKMNSSSSFIVTLATSMLHHYSIHSIL